MKTHIIQFMAVVLVLGMTIVAVDGGIWESDPTRLFRLDVKSIESYNMTEADKLWVQSLVKNLVAKGGLVAKHHVFIRTNGVFTVSKPKTVGIVYVNRDDPDEFITSAPTFFVDFATSKVGMLVLGEQSLHAGPDQNFIVIIDSAGGELGGIPVSSGGVPPKFVGRVVTWY